MAMKNGGERRAMAARYQAASDEAIREKWLALRPRVQRNTVLFAAGAGVLFGINHFVMLSQQVHDYLTIGFQLCTVFAVCLLFMTVMTYVFGRTSKE